MTPEDLKSILTSGRDTVRRVSEPHSGLYIPAESLTTLLNALEEVALEVPCDYCRGIAEVQAHCTYCEKTGKKYKNTIANYCKECGAELT